MKYVRCAFVFLLFFAGLSVTLSSQSYTLASLGMKKGNDLPIPISAADFTAPWKMSDSNGDGKPDYCVLFDESGKKKYEAVDYNKDGKMDELYAYEDGVLLTREIDVNFDGIMDIWVHLYQGVYVESFERSSHCDGIVDIVKDFRNTASGVPASLHK